MDTIIYPYSIYPCAERRVKSMTSYTTETAAAALSMTRRAVRAAINRGEIRAVRIGKEYRISSEEIGRLLQGGA
jgi:excisionase family DNA binding protein